MSNYDDADYDDENEDDDEDDKNAGSKESEIRPKGKMPSGTTVPTVVSRALTVHQSLDCRQQ